MSGTPVCVIDANGITKPDYATVLTYVQDQFRNTFGADIYLGNDVPDGQFAAIVAKAIDDCNAQAVAVFNAASPATAQGAGLSNIVKVNGIARHVATQSTVDLLIVGQVGTVITNGLAGNDGGFIWEMPASVVIPSAGQITITATCRDAGANRAQADTVTQIITPVPGWQSVNNPSDAVPGAPVESDAQLRVRQALSTSQPAAAMLTALSGAISAVTGVTRWRIYENATDAIDVNGLPGHTIACVVEGGDTTAIAQKIALRKAPGVGTYGNIIVTVTDSIGVRDIAFSQPVDVPIAWQVALKALDGYTSTIGAEIKQALAGWTGMIGIGQKVTISRAYVPANLTGIDASTFEIVSIAAARSGNVLAPIDVPIAFDEVATCLPTNVSILLS